MSEPEDELAFQLDAVGIAYEREYKFCPGRRWQADFYIKPLILVEVEGGIWMRGRHNRPIGYAGDCEKYNRAQLLQFMVLRFTPDDVTSGRALNVIDEAINIRREWNG